MALVLLPGLSNLIDDISDEKKLPPQVVEAALREALLKGYERYRRTLYIGISEDPFDEEYFSNFDVGLDLDEEGGLASRATATMRTEPSWISGTSFSNR